MSRKPNEEQVKMMKSRGYLTVREAAESFNVNKWSLYRWMRLGKVQTEKIASTSYVEVESLKSHIGEFGVMVANVGQLTPQAEQ
jgi:hypothetical protein